MSGEGGGIGTRLLLVAGINVAVCTVVSELVNSIVKQPYLDESFHIPQAQRYCIGDYDTYDPKLTTPPGLYFMSIAYARISYDIREMIPLFTNLKSTPCHTVTQLRYMSLMALLLLPWLLSLYKQDSKGIKSSSGQPDPHTVEMHVISLVPPLWFFGFLYYTDVPSTVIIFGCLLAAKKKYHLLASLLGCASLTLRQTNIVWVLFAMGTSLLEEFESLGLDNRPLMRSSTFNQLRSISRIPSKRLAATVIRLFAYYSPVAFLSLAFILRNGRIVLGDQDNHQVSLHWVQPLYCITMLTVFGWPALLSSLGRSFKSPSQWLRSIPLFILVTLSCAAAINYGTIAHPFLLADNRHYTFYIWKRVIDRTYWSRYALAPIYAVMLQLWCNALTQGNSFFWVAGFFLCSCAAIIPSPLIEPRYFLLPYLIARLHLFSDSKRSDLTNSISQHPIDRRKPHYNRMDPWLLAVEGIWFLLINAVTMYLFLYRPFRWPDSLQWQRFMW